MTDRTRNQPTLLPHLTVVALALMLSTCAENPVTGDRELAFVSERQEISLGQENYRPTQQSQGGQWKIDPELTAYVNEVGQRVAEQSPRDLPYEFVVLNNSIPNAWALPGGKIAINRGLLTEFSNEAELAAVLGHEVVHSAARHGAQSMERGLLLQGALLVTSVAAQNNEYAGVIVGGAQLGAQLISTRYGRDAEREGDLYGTRYMAEAGYDPAAAVSLQETFVRLSEGRTPPGWLDGLFASHPPSTERVQNNRELVAQLRTEGFTNGELGEQRYQQRTARLRETQPAYEAFDEVYELLRDDLLPTALAMNELGTMALAANDRGAAKQYFEQAATAPGQLGAQAQASYICLDVADNPGKYVQAQAFVGSGGQIQVRVVNRSPVDLGAIELELQASVGRGTVRRAVAVHGLASGQARYIDSGLTLPAEIDPQTVQAQVLVRRAAIN